MKNLKLNVLYPIGTYLDKVEDGKRHIDQVCEYVINKEGLFAVLLLDATEDPRLSTRISVEELEEKWKLTQDVHLNISDDSIRESCRFLSRLKKKTK